MLCALIAVICALWAADSATCATSKCANKACFTLHTEKVTFESARENCLVNGGYLMTVRDEHELQAVKSLLELAGKLSVKEKVWIGLKLSKGSCVLSDKGLRGFTWISSGFPTVPPVSSYSNWGKEPRSTCTEERCVSLSASTEELKWRDVSCKERALYMCVYYFRGMCKPLFLAGPGEIHYTVPFLNVSLKQHSGLAMLPHATLAEISCTYDSSMNTSVMCKPHSDSDSDRRAHFVWNKPGPFCASAQRSCETRNGGCDQLCVGDVDTGVRCECKKDYSLADNNVTCLRNDACSSSPCQHDCASKPTGFACTCRKGFELSEDKVGCKDVNECTQDICKGHMCHNKQGGYECECKKGFKYVDGMCKDIDECADSVCARHAKCLNSDGSFSCYCLSGFRKHGEQCVDIDECVDRPCEGICSNTEGSYTCSYGPDFRLAENGISCVPDQNGARASHDSEILLTKALDQTAVRTVTPRLNTETTTETHQSVRKEGSMVGSWVLVYALSSVIPLLLLITLTAVIVVHRWNRSRKDAKKKNATTDSYCWVSSGYTSPLETQRNRIY